MIKLINNLPYSANVAKANINRVVRIKYTRSFRPNDCEEVIASIKSVEERFNLINFGHPYDVNKNFTIAGAIGLDYETDKIDITFIDAYNFSIWLKHYMEFHHSIVAEKGYDSSMEDLENIKF